MSLLTDLSELFGDAFEKAGLERGYGEVVVSQRPELGQFQCNGALPAGKAAQRNPREIAAEVVDLLPKDGPLAEVSIAGPGFINLTLMDDVLAAHATALAADSRLGCARVAEPRKVLVDYAGPNVAKSLHVGHLRPSIIGEALKRMFRFAGHDVLGDIHLGDWGTQMGLLIIETQRRMPDLPYFDPEYTGPYPEDSPVTLDDLQEMYPEAAAAAERDPIVAEQARRATRELQAGRPGYRTLWQHFVDVSLQSQRADFAVLGVDFDLWLGESAVHDRIGPLIDRLKEAGVAEESEGALIVDVSEPDESREIPPLMLVKSDGAYLYSTTDLATIEQRVSEFGSQLILYVVDARQALHFEQLFRAARRGGVAPEDVGLEHIGFGTMNDASGRPFKTRSGEVLPLRALLDMVTEAAARRLREADIAQEYEEAERRDIAFKVGVAALKFGDLSNHRTSNYHFDPERFTSFEGKTGPYLLYGAVRIKSILRRAGEEGLSGGPVMAPEVDAERNLILQMSRLPEALDRAVQFRSPNHLAEFGYDLATSFNRFYDTCHILREEDEARQSGWITLVEATLAQLELVLDLLGIPIPERM